MKKDAAKTSKANSQSALRSDLKQRRSSIAPWRNHCAGLQAAKNLANLNRFQQAKRIAVYLDTAGELPTKGILNLAKRYNKQVFLPVISPNQIGIMQFKKNSPFTQKNRFNITEPHRLHQSQKTHTFDLVIVPLVGFNRQGDRLGMGGGYYDRAFANKTNQQRNHKPWLVGIAFSVQQTKKLSANPWDVKLDAVITEFGTHIFNSALR